MRYQPLLPAVLFAAIAGIVRADPVSQVTSTGTSTIMRTPETIRMTLELTGEGKETAEALAALATKRDAFKKRLELTAPVHADFSEPQLSTIDESRRQMEMLRGRGNAQPAPTVKLAVTVKADWPLAGKTAEERLLSAAAIAEKLKAPPAAAPTTKSAVPTTQSEAEEEMAAMQAATTSESVPEPSFVYVAMISPADRAKAIGEAYNDAKANATQTAGAIGLSIGVPLDIKTSIAPTRDKPDSESAYVEIMLAAMQKPSPNSALAGATEATGFQPNSVGLTVTVTASFALVVK